MGSLGITWKNFLITATISIAVALFARSFFLETYRIPTGSMEPALIPGDIIVVNKAKYGFHHPFKKDYLLRWGQVERGDIIVFPLPDDDSRVFVKRVFGIGGDHIRISKDGQAFLVQKDSAKMSEEDDRLIQLKENQLFVLGDNLEKGTDSRHWGPVDEKSVIGKTWKVISKGEIQEPQPLDLESAALETQAQKE